MKTIKILFLSIFLIFLANTVSAVVVYGEWNDNYAQSIEIEDGDSVDFSAYFGTISPPMTINMGLYDSGNNLIHSFEDTVVNQKSFAQIYTINQNIYSRPGDFQVRILGSDNFGEMTHILYLEVINYPPEITSVPIIEVNENEFYSYQVVAVDPDNHQLTYSLSVAPDWLSINPSSGLITGTAPEVDADTYFDVSVVASDGIDTDTQSYILTVRYIPNPFISQTLNLINDINVEYNAILSELDSAVLEIYYKEFGSTNYGLIETRNINTPSYNEIFDFYAIHGVTKGDYRFIITDSDSGLSETDEIIVPDYVPEVDLSSIFSDFNEEDSTGINLPVPTDINPEDAPVAYTTAVSLDGKTTTSLDSANYVLTLTGNRDEIGAYAVELEFGDSNGETASEILNGYIYNLPDISGVLENNEEDLGEQGVIRVYYQDPNNSSNYLVLEIDKINDGEGSIIDAGLGKIQTTSDGIFNFQINKKASELNEIILQARIGTSQTYTGYVRTIEFSGDDNLNVLVRAVPYNGLNENGISVQDFRKHAQEVLTKEDNPPENADPWIFKWNFGEDPNSSSLFKEVIISKQNPGGDGYFEAGTANEIRTRILNPDDIGAWFRGKINNTDQVRIEDSWIFEEPRDYGRIIIYPSININDAIVHDRTGDGYLDIGRIRVSVNNNGELLDPRTIVHEFGHISGLPGHAETLPQELTIMRNILVPSYPANLRFADIKTAKAIYEDNYKHGMGMMNWLRLGSILGLNFYGESQITGTFNEYYSKVEEEDSEEQQDSNENNIIGSEDIASISNSNRLVNNADILYEETIYLQSNEDKNNIITSLSDILKRVISFISQKLKSVFAIF